LRNERVAWTHAYASAGIFTHDSSAGPRFLTVAAHSG
jgi:hypothetical protein